MSARDLPLNELLAHAAGVTAHVDPQARVESGVLIGDGCTVKCGAVLVRGTRLGRNVTVGANAVFVEAEAGEAGCVVEDGARIGAGAVLYAGISIGARALVRPGAVVLRSVPPAAIVEGNPAAITGYVDALPQALQHRAAKAHAHQPISQTAVRGVSVHTLPQQADLAGTLAGAEFVSDLPFVPQRFGVVLDVPGAEVRAGHALRSGQQFLVCVRGSCAVLADDGHNKVEVTLDSARRGLYLPPMTWGLRHRHSADAVLMVFEAGPAAGVVQAVDTDRIDSYGEFLQHVKLA